MSIIGRVAPFLAGSSGGGPYRYLRLLVTKVNANTKCAIDEVYWSVGGTDYPTSTMTNNSAPSPLVASVSSAYGGYYAYYLFNRSSTSWVTADNTFLSQVGSEWVTIDLGAGNGITPTGIGITAYSVVSFYTPVDFACYGSNTGAFSGEQTQLYSATGLTTGWAGSTRRNFTF